MHHQHTCCWLYTMINNSPRFAFSPATVYCHSPWRLLGLYSRQVAAHQHQASFFVLRLCSEELKACVESSTQHQEGFCDCLCFVQVAIVAGTMFVFVEILAACLFLVTRDINNNGYYPSSGMVTFFHACDTVSWCHTSCRCHTLSCMRNQTTRCLLSSALYNPTTCLEFSCTVQCQHKARYQTPC